MEEENIFIRPIKMAEKLFVKHHTRGMDFKNFRCDFFLAKIFSDEQIKLDILPFRTDKFCGLLNIDEDETTILINKNSPAYRRNFTIAHELGHYFLHRDMQSIFPDRAKDLLNSSNKPLEQQANAFASELVLPVVVLNILIRSMYSFKRISSVTQTSHECLRWRLVRYLRDQYGTTHNQSVKAVNQFEDVSIYGNQGAEDFYNILRGKSVVNRFANVYPLPQ